MTASLRTSNLVEPIEITVATAETSGRALSLVPASTQHEPVATLRVGQGAITVMFHVLAASHRVEVFHYTDLVAVETVVCDVAGSPSAGGSVRGSLPRHATWRSGAWFLTFDAAVVDGNDAIHAARQRLADTVRVDEGIVARFPGDPDAITALALTAATPRSVSWNTWHLYPGSDPHVVHTSTSAVYDAEEA